MELRLFLSERKTKMMYSRQFVRFSWLTLVFIFLVTCAGSLVRITGSGMGCPDWPKCFGQYIPPTEASQLPDNYKEIYAGKRAKKVERFAKFLTALGMKKEAQQLLNDPTLLQEQDFNASKTWTEYINRLFGVLAGFGVLGMVIWVMRKYRTRKLVFLSWINLVFLMVQAWFGSIVVATNLVPWTITVHLFLAIVIIFIQLVILLEVSPSQKQKLAAPRWVKAVVGISLVITFIQMFLGTQVREAVDVLVMNGYTRSQWVEMLGTPFYIHRTFSWLVMLFLVLLAYQNFKGAKHRVLYSAFIVLAIELISGVLLAYADMPGLVQTAHLIFATVILSILFMAYFRLKTRK